MTERLSPLTKCAKFVYETKYEDLPQEVVDFIKKDILDWVGTTVVGSFNPVSEPFREVVHWLGGKRQVEIVGCKKSNLHYATISNAYFGALSNSGDYDKNTFVHPGIMCIPPAFALSQFYLKNAKDLIVAIACGFEVMLRIASVCPCRCHSYDPTSTAGGFGSAMTSGKLLDLSYEHLLYALENVTSNSGHLWQFLSDGASAKYLQLANAAGTGIFTSLITSDQIGLPTKIPENNKNLFADSERLDPNFKVFEDFGKVWRTLQVSIPLYPGCSHTLSAIDSALEIRPKLKGKKISSVTVKTYNIANTVAGVKFPLEPNDAKFSLSYCFASTLIRGRPTLKDFSESMIDDPEVRSIEKLVQIEESEEFRKNSPNCYSSKIEVRTSDGDSFTCTVQLPKEDPEKTITWNEVTHKFEMLTNKLLFRWTQEKIISLCKILEGLNEPTQILDIVNYDTEEDEWL